MLRLPILFLFVRVFCFLSFIRLFTLRLMVLRKPLWSLVVVKVQLALSHSRRNKSEVFGSSQVALSHFPITYSHCVGQICKCFRFFVI